MTTNYSTLQSDIIAYTENDSDEFAASLPRIIENSQLKIYREADLNRFREYCTTIIEAGTRFIDYPSSYVVDRWVKGVAGETENAQAKFDILPKDTSFIQTFWPTPTERGQPRYYADWDADTFAIAPTADQTYTIILAYIKRDTFLSDSSMTNWLTDNAGDILLYASLIESYAFMKLEDENNPNLAFWKNEYNERLVALKNEEERRQRMEELRHGEKR